MRDPSSEPEVPTPMSERPLRVYRAGTAGRGAVESLVRRVYRRRFGAEVRDFAPTLLGLHDAAGRLVAAAGCRPARDGALFLERYLDAPVQALIGAGADRSRIVEVGHLAAIRAGEGRRLVTGLGPHLLAEGQDWVVCTLTAELRHLLVRLGAAPMTLGVADPARLGADAGRWGRYYEHRPLVLALRLDAAVARHERRGGAGAAGTTGAGS